MARRFHSAPSSAEVASAMNAAYLSQLQGYGPPAVSYNPNYYRNLVAQGLAVDPATGHEIPTQAVAKGTKGALPAPTKGATVKDDRGPQTFINPHADPYFTAAEAPGQAAFQAEQQQPIPRTAPTTQFGDAQQMLGQLLQPATPAGQAEAAKNQLIDLSPEQEAFSTALHQRGQALMDQAAADMILMLEEASKPGTLHSDLLDLQQQWDARYPFAKNLKITSMSPEQIAQLKKERVLDSWRDRYEKIGLPRDLIIDVDSKGEPIGPSPADFWRAQSERGKQQFEAEKERREFAKLERQTWLKQEPAPPTLVEINQNPNAMQEYEAKREAWQSGLTELNQTISGFDPTAYAQAVTPQAPPVPQNDQAIQAGTRPHINLDTAPDPQDQVRKGLASGNWGKDTILQLGGNLYRVTGGNPPLEKVK